MVKPLVLCILDGVGIRNREYGNAFMQANKPNFNRLWNSYPHCLLEASGAKVGLPNGQMGNSEVGHMNIGAGRIVYQPLQYINEQIRNKQFFNNEKILKVIEHTKRNNSKLHVFGLLSDGGIHSHINHLFALLEICEKNNVKNLYLHLFLDGRDTLPKSALGFIELLSNKMAELGIGSIATISGRYYAMDRDNRWDRIKKAYDVIVNGVGPHYESAKAIVNDNYANDITDEFIVPSIIDKNGIIEDNDGLITFNFRPDRLRELFYALTNQNFNEFETKKITNIKLVTMFSVSDDVVCENAFEHQNLNNTLGEYLSNNGKTQLRIAETEKYAHVTYFFDGGVEKDLKGCDRILIPSPKVATYDLKPEMSAREITDTLLNKIKEDIYDVIIVNFANGDMVGHTGNFAAATSAIQVLDECLGKIDSLVKEKDGLLIITADHGNCDYMLDDDGNVITSHSTSLVPFIVTDNTYKLMDGKLGDIAPTILNFLNIDIPKDMTGDILTKQG